MPEESLNRPSIEERLQEHLNELDETSGTFFKEGYIMAHSKLGQQITVTGIMDMTHQLYETIDGLIKSFTERALKEEKPVACREGCFYCCHNTVHIMPHEAIFLDNYVRDQFTGKEISTLKQRCSAKNMVTRELDRDALLKTRHACPLLNDMGSCTVYEARPMACRIYLSYDFTSCLQDYTEPDGERFPALFEFPLVAGRFIHLGATMYMEERRLIDGDGTLESMLGTMLEEYSNADKWIEGGDVFPVRDWEKDQSGD